VKNKEKPLFPNLHQIFELKQDSILYFVRKVIEKGGIWTEDKYSSFFFNLFTKFNKNSIKKIYKTSTKKP